MISMLISVEAFFLSHHKYIRHSFYMTSWEIVLNELLAAGKNQIRQKVL